MVPRVVVKLTPGVMPSAGFRSNSWISSSDRLALAEVFADASAQASDATKQAVAATSLRAMLAPR